MTNQKGEHIGSLLSIARKEFHADLFRSVLRVTSLGVPNNSDKNSKQSVLIGKAVLENMSSSPLVGRHSGQRAGKAFEEVCAQYLKGMFPHLSSLRPGRWEVGRVAGGRLAISQYDQYQHLSALDEAAHSDKELAAALGTDYLIRPDVVISRAAEEDEAINQSQKIVDDRYALLSSLRAKNLRLPTLHASISCKWTLRSDRAQNARSEALNLIRNRKGRLPHIVVVTGEPTPNRIASLALGTGDIDCVYHFALPELQQSVKDLEFHDAEETLETMIEGKRLKAISDLPLDLAV